MKEKKITVVWVGVLLLAALFFAVLYWILRENVPRRGVRLAILVCTAGISGTAFFWVRFHHRQVALFADDICEMLDALMAGREPENYFPYEDSLSARVQGKLMQYCDMMKEEGLQNRRDKETIQELVSDISHQVKTPVANIKMFTGILKKHALSEEKREEFLSTLEGQINKLDFLMQSLIKMSRLETGTFVLHMKEAPLSETIARAMSGVWAAAERKHISLEVQCHEELTAFHDPKWTAEAVGNLLDNAVKYTPDGGTVQVTVEPWQFYTKLTVSDTGIGIDESHYHDVFQRFFREEEAADKEGVGLGLYLANGIINKQKGYISVKSQKGKGTAFSVYLLS